MILTCIGVVVRSPISKIRSCDKCSSVVIGIRRMLTTIFVWGWFMNLVVHQPMASSAMMRSMYFACM
mgnify:CR=1 FL=1